MRFSPKTYESMDRPCLMLLCFKYVDDLLLAVADTDSCVKATEVLLKIVQGLGYIVSAKKAQICIPKVTYLEFKLKVGQRTLSQPVKRPS